MTETTHGYKCCESYSVVVLHAGNFLVVAYPYLLTVVDYLRLNNVFLHAVSNVPITIDTLNVCVMILIIMILLFKTYIYIERQMYNQKDMSLYYNTICVYYNLMHLTYTEFNSLKASETSEAIRICNVIKNKQIATSDLLTFGTYTSNYMFLFVTNVLERAPNKEEC